MEYDTMTASFASISGKSSASAGREEKRRKLTVQAHCPDTGGAGFNPRKKAPVKRHILAQSAHESFASIVNAKNCANANSEEILKSYLTLARQSSYLRSYMY